MESLVSVKGGQEYVYGATPPETSTVAVPTFPSGQVSLVMVVTNVNGAGSLIVVKAIAAGQLPPPPSSPTTIIW